VGASAQYWRRKAQGLCPRCGQAARGGRVYCAVCQPARKDQFAPLVLSTPSNGGVPEPEPDAGVGGSFLACCGRWHAVTQLPLRVVCCGRVYLALAEEAEEAEGAEEAEEAEGGEP
jgi:hypothetical protein